MKYIVNPLTEKQLSRLKFLLNDWKHNISPDDLDTQEITISSIISRMKEGVEQ